MRFDDVEHGPGVRFGRRGLAPVEVREAADRAGHADQERMVGALAVLQGLGQQVDRVHRLGHPAGDHAPHDQRESTAPVVGRGRELAVGPAGGPVGGGEIAEFGGGVRLDRAQRRDGPLVTDPLAERQEHAGQPFAPRPADPASSRANAVVPRSQARPTGSCFSANSRAARPSVASAPAKSPRVVATQARFCSDHAWLRGSRSATATW